MSIQFYFHRKLSFLFKIGWYNNSHYIFIHLYFFLYFSYTNGFCNASRSTHKLCKFRLIAADLTWAKLQSGKCPPVSKRTTPHKPNAEIFLHARSIYDLGNTQKYSIWPSCTENLKLFWHAVRKIQLIFVVNHAELPCVHMAAASENPIGSMQSPALEKCK